MPSSPNPRRRTFVSDKLGAKHFGSQRRSYGSRTSSDLRPDRLAATMTVTALAWEIDSPSPALPLPFIRERRIWGDVTNKDYEGQLGRARHR
jgi:hypothetical protein